MALPVWPAGLPQIPERPGYDRRPRPSILVFPTEVGAGKRRNRSSIRIKSVTVIFNIDLAQIGTFETFFDITLGEGSKPFTMKDPLDGATYRWQFVEKDPYAITPKGNGGRRYALTCKLERLS